VTEVFPFELEREGDETSGYARAETTSRRSNDRFIPGGRFWTDRARNDARRTVAAS